MHMKSIPLVFPGGNLSIYFLEQIYNHSHNDQKSGTTDSYGANTSRHLNDKRKDPDKPEEQSANHSQPKEYSRNMRRGRRARTHARYKGPASLKIFGNGIRIKGDRGVKISKDKHEQEVSYRIKSLVGKQIQNKLRNALDDFIVYVYQKTHYHLGKKKYGESKNYRYHSGLIHP